MYISTTNRIQTYVKALVIQGCLFLLVSLLYYKHLGLLHTVIISLEVVAVKIVLIPFFLMYTSRKLDIQGDGESSKETYLSVCVAAVVMFICLTMAVTLKKSGSYTDVLSLGISASAVFIGLFIMTTRRRPITHVIGFMVLVNGVFLASLSLASRAAFMVEAGMLLDVLTGGFIVGIFFNNIKSCLVAGA
ncbi:MAG: hypothetical protein HQL06_04975 [Nitrospirae bacterium]|nr:hypothetical protein [Nitrospirota bacterium]